MQPIVSSLNAVNATNDPVTCELRAFMEDQKCCVTVTYNARVIKKSGMDFFHALTLVREVLEEDGLLLKCYGASLNVFPSGMSREGVTAYKKTLGQPVTPADRVKIFEDGPDINPATVAEQKHWNTEWFNNFGRK